VKYRQEHGELPQTFVSPEGYKHSWRLLVAPALFDRWAPKAPFSSTYRFDRPWDSKENRRVVAAYWVTSQFTCPFEAKSFDYRFVTDVMLVRGKTKAAKDGSSRRAPLPSEAVLIVESSRCGIECGEPRDLNWDDLWAGESPFGRGKLYSLHPDVVKAIRVDGKVIDIPKDITKDRLRALLDGKPYSVATGGRSGVVLFSVITAGVLGVLIAWCAWVTVRGWRQ
jgi:hypothetical protein